MGIVNRVLPKETLEEETLAFTEKIAEMPPLPIRMSKRLMNATMLNQLDAALEWEAQATPLSCMAKEFKDYIADFTSKKVRRFV